jgi:aminoglycoside phosphotransferase
MSLGKESSDRPTQSQSQPINATASKRFLTLLAIKLLKRFRKRYGSVLFLSDKICVKYGSLVNLSEASTMQFVAKHTSIPVPRVYCAFVHQDRTYIVMERIHGEQVRAGWVWRSKGSQAKILNQLKKMIEELRRITPPPGTGVASVDGGSLYDVRMPGSSNRFGPFRTIEEFHRHLRNNLETHPEHIPEIAQLIAQQDKPWPGPVLTHADLSSLNILAAGDEVTGIIDWETSGWYPAYWEYTSAWNVNPYNEFWREEVDKFLQPMPEALEMEKIRIKYFSAF